MSIMQLTQTIHILPSGHSLQSNRALQPMFPGLEPEEETRPMVTYRQIAEALSSIAGLLAFQNSNPYRIQAYRNAARGILDLPGAAVLILAGGEALPIPGV